MPKTENPENVGRHAFEAAGLGIAPFRFSGFALVTYQACPGAPVQTGTCCDYCGAGIMNVCYVKDVNGKTFKVGPDCINKVGDEGLLKAYKTSPEYRKHQRDLRQKKYEAQQIAACKLLADNAEYFKSLPHPRGFVDRETGTPMTFFDYLDWMIGHCGMAGTNDLLKFINRKLAERENGK